VQVDDQIILVLGALGLNLTLILYAFIQYCMFDIVKPDHMSYTMYTVYFDNLIYKFLFDNTRYAWLNY